MKLLGQRSVKADLNQVGVLKSRSKTLPSSVNLRPWCSPIEDQGRIGLCTAQAAVGLVEYFEQRAFGTHKDASRLFIYKTTRNLLHFHGDTGAYLRTTMGALALFGAPPEKYWPYTDDPTDFNLERTPFCYAFAQHYRAIRYYRLDPPGVSPAALLNSVKMWLAAGLPSMFGFTVYSSYEQAGSTGKIPMPTRQEQNVGGHAVVVVGYDDNMHIKNNNPEVDETVGALLIRNSWGKQWGDYGYGWLPYDYVLQRLAVDWWSLIKTEWVDTRHFGF